MPAKVRVPKTRKQIARPKKEWVEFGFGLGRMRDAALARSKEEIFHEMEAILETVKDKAALFKTSPDPNVYQNFWYTLQYLKKYLEIIEKEYLDKDLFHLGVSVPEIFTWDRMYKFATKKKATGKKK